MSDWIHPDFIFGMIAGMFICYWTAPQNWPRVVALVRRKT